MEIGMHTEGYRRKVWRVMGMIGLSAVLVACMVPKDEAVPTLMQLPTLTPIPTLTPFPEFSYLYSRSVLPQEEIRELGLFSTISDLFAVCYLQQGTIFCPYGLPRPKGVGLVQTGMGINDLRLPFTLTILVDHAITIPDLPVRTAMDPRGILHAVFSINGELHSMRFGYIVIGQRA